MIFSSSVVLTVLVLVIGTVGILGFRKMLTLLKARREQKQIEEAARQRALIEEQRWIDETVRKEMSNAPKA